MFGKMWSAALYGVDARIVHVEVDIASGLPQVNVVGLPDAAIRESVERMRAAIRNCGWKFPMERITINLAPADLRKEGTSFDLAMTIAVLTTSKQLEQAHFANTFIVGELALDGQTRPIPGILSLIDEAQRNGFKRVLVPAENAAEALLVGGIEVYALSHLTQLRQEYDSNDGHLLDHLLQTNQQEQGARISVGDRNEVSLREDYADIVGHVHVKRAMTIAAAGMHNIILSGAPGTGKTMLIRRLPTILPPLNEKEALEVSKIYSVSGKWDRHSEQLMNTRPFRSPHHSISAAGLIGGGSIPKPGEVSLAHRGVLFLDELPEFQRPALEALRQPLEDRSVTIARARAVFCFPAHVMLAASMNPCSCGFHGGSQQRCQCSAFKLQQYRARLSGPLLDRIDLQVDVPRLPLHEWDQPSMTSATMRSQVMEAQARQHARYKQLPISFNSELNGVWLKRFSRLDTEAAHMLRQAYEMLGLSLRAHDRLLKLARTIADVEHSEQIHAPHIAEAIQYRSLDRPITH
ncbi:YifB family Mg chelatase-like AAA ATPase [Paenibacillus sp. 481]|uniref:YifB family Mg chelatase-like AAA ATPase n=1 Tax=Paenibacillus sp. 481 TaxID=2835869 RepID=UPI001E5148D3|nr:YifB family Mg chelatase-like AAA ATPase [Paenibacillus sp. 481]UHA73951.1 YifB family Mg chelatase-like AAA ATPase [Paenibacillus sp. 481]